MLAWFYSFALKLNKIKILFTLVAVLSGLALIALIMFDAAKQLPPIPFVLSLTWALLLSAIASAFQNKPTDDNRQLSWWQRVKLKFKNVFLMSIASMFCGLILVTFWLTIRLLMIMGN